MLEYVIRVPHQESLCEDEAQVFSLAYTNLYAALTLKPEITTTLYPKVKTDAR